LNHFFLDYSPDQNLTLIHMQELGYAKIVKLSDN